MPSEKIKTFQQKIKPNIEQSVSSWLFLALTFTDKELLQYYFKRIIKKCFKKNHYSDQLKNYISSNINIEKHTNEQIIEHITNMFLKAMLKWENDDDAIKTSFRVNCYNSRLIIFLSHIHTAVLDIKES